MLRRRHKPPTPEVAAFQLRHAARRALEAGWSEADVARIVRRAARDREILYEK